MLGAVDSQKRGTKPRPTFLWSPFFWCYFRRLHIANGSALIDEGPLVQTPGVRLCSEPLSLHHGLHCLHVICGVVALIVISRGFSRGGLTAASRDYRLYWHFVDLVGCLCALIYLSTSRGKMERTVPVRTASPTSLQNICGILCVARHRWRRGPLGYRHFSIGSLLGILLALAICSGTLAVMYFMHLRRAAKFVLDPHSVTIFCSATDEHDLVGQFSACCG